MSAAELAAVGEEALRGHLLAQAQVAHARHAPICGAGLDALLRDRECVRHPVRLEFGFGGMAPHQFAQPEPDRRDPCGTGVVLCLRPLLRDRPEWVALAVAYMIPVINYGEGVVGDAHCLLYGAALLGLTEDEFYQELCSLAEFVGAEEKVDP